MSAFKFGQRVRVTEDGFYKNVIGNVVAYDDGEDVSGPPKCRVALSYNTFHWFDETGLETT